MMAFEIIVGHCHIGENDLPLSNHWMSFIHYQMSLICRFLGLFNILDLKVCFDQPLASRWLRPYVEARTRERKNTRSTQERKRVGRNLLEKAELFDLQRLAGKHQHAR